jgi:predicted acylesterase/phospholipase RssA
MTRIGLVLGAGGAVGHAFHAGVLAGLAEVTGWDARDSEVIVGTSAGSVVGALLRAGLSGPDLAAHSTDGAMSEDGRRITARADAARNDQSPIPTRPQRRTFRGASAPSALVRARCNRGMRVRARSRPRHCPRAAYLPSSSRRDYARCSQNGRTGHCGSSRSTSNAAGE